MRLVLPSPDIPQNVGAMLRLAGCLGIAVDLIEPLGFVWSSPKLRRAGMDYLDLAQVRRHASWGAYADSDVVGRLVLIETDGQSLPGFTFRRDDRLVMGSESAGAAPAVAAACAARVAIPMVAGARSLNVATAAAIVLAEALRQTGQWPIKGGS